MIDLDTAVQIAEKFLNDDIAVAGDDSIVVVDVIERPDGWLMAYNSRKFTQTGDLLYAVVGAPLFVSADGETRYEVAP